MSSQFPVREARKAQTRANLIRAAIELFADNGYDNTTLEQVADRAGMHVQTLYRHFRNKQELATAGDHDLLAQFRTAITDPNREGDTFTFWRGWLERLGTQATQDGGKAYRSLLKQRYGVATMSTQLVAIGQQYEDLLAAALAEDFGECAAHSDSNARLAAITLIGGSNYVTRRYATEDNLDLVAESLKVVDKVQVQQSSNLASKTTT